MREIEFRGIAKEGLEDVCKKGDWVFGNLIVNGGRPFIVGDVVESDDEYILFSFWVPVKPQSIGQFTGVHDKNGKKIYGDDIVQSTGNYPVKVIWEKDGWTTENCDITYQDEPGRAFSEDEDWEVMGNIYSNPELIKK